MNAIKHVITVGCFLVFFSVIVPFNPVKADYASIASAQTDYIQAHFYDSSLKRYLIRYPGKAYSDSWANGVELALLVDATRYNPSEYQGVLHDFSDGLSAYWNPTGPVPGYNATMSGPKGTDRYYDDNAWLAIDFADAYSATRDPFYLQLAWGAQNFVLSGWDNKLGGGIYWNIDKTTKNTCANAPAATAALLLANLSHNQDQIAWAVKIRTWLNDNLQDTDGLYWDNIDLNGKIEKTKWTYNSALMIWANVLLYQESGDSSTLAEARRIADASIARFGDPLTGSLQKTEDSPLFTHLLCESLIKLYVATHDIKYLNVVRSEASFAYRYAHLSSGGFSDNWTTAAHDPQEKQSLIMDAAAGRLFWMLSPYPDVDTLTSTAEKLEANGDLSGAEGLFRQAAASDKSDVRSRFELTKVLTEENKLDEAKLVDNELFSIAKDPAEALKLSNLGWKATTN